MADEQTQNAKPSSLRSLGMFLYGAACRVLGTAAEHLKQRWTEVRPPQAKRGSQTSTPGADTSQPAT